MYKLVKLDNDHNKWSIQDEEGNVIVDGTSTVFFTGKSELVGLTLPQLVWVCETLNDEAKKAKAYEQARVFTALQTTLEEILKD